MAVSGKQIENPCFYDYRYVYLLYFVYLFTVIVTAQDTPLSPSDQPREIPPHTLLGEEPHQPPPPELVEKLRNEANGGSKDGQYFLGLLYYYGQGVIKDETVAMRLFREAALQGHAQAAANLGVMLEYGSTGTSATIPVDSSLNYVYTVPKRLPDLSGAFAWYSAAAAAGEPHGMFHAGLMLYENRVPNYDEHERIADAFQYFERAVKKQFPEAYYYLGLLYEYGAHKPQNFVKAMKLYSEGCLNPNIQDSDCCFNLGLLYAYGRGIEQNYPDALAIFQACYNNYHHAGCTLYLGLMHAAGQGTAVDYEAAQVYLQQAAESTDLRFVESAHTAYHNLNELMKEAQQGISKTLDDIAQGIANKPTELHNTIEVTGSQRTVLESNVRGTMNKNDDDDEEEEEEL